MVTSDTHDKAPSSALPRIGGREAVALLALIALAAIVVFRDGLVLLSEAWTLPEYAHGPLIPVISLLLLHRQIARDDGVPGPIAPRMTAWLAGGAAIVAVLAALFGSLSGLAELSAYGIVVFAAALIVAGLGWPASARFWHPVVHLSFMLPLPGLVYYGTTTALQGFSSEAGVMFIRAFDIPVVLNGNVIDMGAVKLLVAEACSGLRYMFPILSFSYVLAILYKGPKWKKLAIFAMAVPTAVAVNAFRIAMIGLAYGLYDVPPSEGFAHVFEGWVVFLVSIGLIAAAAAALSPGGRPRFDTDFGAPRIVAAKLRATHTLSGLRAVAAIAVVAALASLALPDRDYGPVDRVPFALMETRIGPWTREARVDIDAVTVETLNADDVFAATFSRADQNAGIELFLAYYSDQAKGGVHSPEICLPGAGWEIETLDRITVTGSDGAGFPAMRAVIRRDLERRVVLYWFDQHGRKTAVDYVAKALLVWDGAVHRRTDGALVRLVTPVLTDETPRDAEARLAALAGNLPATLAPHLPAAPGLT